LTRRRFRRDPTHALFADQSHSIPDNIVALFGRIRAWIADLPPATLPVSPTGRRRLILTPLRQLSFCSY
jgi:hypothetical protein